MKQWVILFLIKNALNSIFSLQKNTQNPMFIDVPFHEAEQNNLTTNVLSNNQGQKQVWFLFLIGDLNYNIN